MFALLTLILIVLLALECYVAVKIANMYKRAKYERKATAEALIIIHNKLRKKRKWQQ